MNMILAAPLALMLALQAAPEWKLVLADEDGKFYYDSASVERSGDSVIVETRLNLEKPSGDTVRFDMLMIVDCPGYRYAYLAGRSYDAAGKLLGSRETPVEDAKYISIPPGSTSAALKPMVCPPI